MSNSSNESLFTGPELLLLRQIEWIESNGHILEYHEDTSSIIEALNRKGVVTLLAPAASKRVTLVRVPKLQQAEVPKWRVLTGSDGAYTENERSSRRIQDIVDIVHEARAAHGWWFHWCDRCGWWAQAG